MSRPADWREREKGLNPDRSWIVQAPAGSGKTELLTQRMLGLLARVEHPEEVVGITFTRKAAAEMRHRMLTRLLDARKTRHADGIEKQLEPHEQVSRELALAVLKNDEERSWNLLDQPGRLRIRTIDSLCSELSRQLPILSGLGGGQQIAENPDALYHQAAARTMAAIEDDSDELQNDVIRVLNRYDNQYDKLVDLLTNMLGHREQWMTHLLEIQTGEGFDRHGLEDSLRYLIESQLETAQNTLPEFLLTEVPRYLNYALTNQPGDEECLRALLDNCSDPDGSRLKLPDTADALPHWVTLANRLITADGKKWRSRVVSNDGFPAPSGARGEEKNLRQEMKIGFVELLKHHAEQDFLREQFNLLRTLPSPDYDEDAWESLESLMRILIRAAAEWKLVMTESGEADFSEIASRAIQALGDEDQPSNLALRMDYRIQHLLVDEFQDTSHSQIRLLNRLTAGWSAGDGHSLFLVGDPMQSIYRFRKAEVSLFIEAFEGRLFDHIALQPLQLSVNFRSTQPVVEWVNSVFPAVMPVRSDPVMGAVRYSCSSARPGAPDNGAVSIRIQPRRDDEEEAQRVVQFIEKCDPAESLAILVRSRKHAAGILALLDKLKEDQARFRYQAIDFNPLADTPLIQDLVSLTLALAQPADRLAWLATLRAPFIGLDLSDLDELVDGNAECILIDAISQNLDDSRPASISASGRARLRRIAPVLLEAVERRGRQSVRSLLESSWLRLGGPACVHNASELDDAAAFFDLIETLENQNLPIDRDTLDQRMEKLYAEPDARASDKLQVMTIYAAKGLQFDTVILPGLNRGTGSDDGKLLHWFELAEEDRIVMSPMRNTADREKQKRSGDLIKFISGIEKKRQAFEDGRLLYVAATRAIHSLCLFAAIKPSAKDEIRPGSGTLLAELWPAIEGKESPSIRRAAMALEDSGKIDDPIDPAEETTNRLLIPQLYRRLAANWELPAPADSVEQLPAIAPDTQDYIEFRWAGEDARLTGNLVHRLLQQVSQTGLADWQRNGGMSSQTDWCRQQLASEGALNEKADGIVTQAAKAIDSCLASERGRWILDSHEESSCEYALTAVLEGQVRNLVLDRTFVEDGTRWIIDYKTSSHSGGDLEGFLDNEAERYSEQLLRYRKAVAINERRPIRTALYFPLLDRFREI